MQCKARAEVPLWPTEEFVVSSLLLVSRHDSASEACPSLDGGRVRQLSVI